MNDTPQPKPTKKLNYKRKIKTPKDINKVSQLTINLKEDHGSRYEPKILTKIGYLVIENRRQLLSKRIS